jgi:DNA-directed RNA polymerase subunit RPC12/RpoP
MRNDDLNILCGQCGQLSVTDDPSGKGHVRCEHCGHEIRHSSSARNDQPVFDTVDVGSEVEGFAEVMRASLARKIHVSCGSCGRGLKVSLRMAGRKATCPACGNRVRLPFAGQESERLLNELIAERSPETVAPKTDIPAEVPAVEEPAKVAAETPELVELAMYVEDDEAALDIDIPEDSDFLNQSPSEMDGREMLALNEAISAFTLPGGLAESHDLPALQKVVKKRRLEAQEGPPERKIPVLMGIAAILLIGVGIWMGLTFFGGDGSEPPPRLSQNTGNTTPNGGNGATKPPNQTPKTRPVIIPKPVKVKAVCKAVTCWTDSFAGSGFFPAAPGQVFCVITVQVTAGDDKLELDNHGDAARLTIATESYRSLGEPVKSILPLLPRKKHLSIPPRGSRTITMLFDLPQKALGTTASQADLSLGKIAPVKIDMGSQEHMRPVKAIADGSTPYTEIAPRNTKPLLSDPVMSVIQSMIPQKLSLRPGPDDSVNLTLGSGKVTGRARQDDRGLYVTKLTYKGDTLQCLLRFTHGGNKAILYLSEEPFHQLTFTRNGWSNSGPIVVPQSQTVIPKPVRPDPESYPFPEPTTRPRFRPNGGRKPGFFGV